jgi:hypothetical protein
VLSFVAFNADAESSLLWLDNALEEEAGDATALPLPLD